MLSTEKVINCADWELPVQRKRLARDGYQILCVDFMSTEKIIIVARKVLDKEKK